MEEQESVASQEKTNPEKELKKSCLFIKESYGLDVYAVAVSTSGLNKQIAIGSSAGEPIQKMVYDAVRDYYLVEGANMLHVGIVPYNFRLCFNGIDNWSVDLPLPVSLIKTLLNENSRKVFEQWLSGQKNNIVCYYFFKRSL